MCEAVNNIKLTITSEGHPTHGTVSRRITKIPGCFFYAPKGTMFTELPLLWDTSF